MTEARSGDRRLALEAGLLLLVSQYALRVFGFRRLIVTLGESGACSLDPALVARIGAAVDLAGDRLGLSCLRRAFAAAWMLRIRGLRPRLHYGVARLGGEVTAHAWLEVGGLPVVGHDRAGDFSLLASFPAVSAGTEAAAAERPTLPDTGSSRHPVT